MSYTTLFVVGQTDTLPVYTVTLTDASGNPVDLSTATAVTFTMSNALAGVVINAAPVTVVSAAAGVVQYSWSSANTTTPGIYAVEWGVVWSTGLTTTYPLHDYDFLMVVNDLAIGYPDVTATFNTIWTGTAAPTSANGNNGDFWYNETSGYFYGPKVSGVWPAGFLLSPSAIPINQLTAPNGNLSINNFKLTNVANGTNPTDGAAFGQIPQLVIDVTLAPYSADPTGATDSTVAIQTALNVAQAAGGGIVYLPAGVYTVTPASATSAALVLNNGSIGYHGVRIVGAGENATMIKRTSLGPVLTMSGPATDSTGITHCRYCALEDIAIHGNNLTGTLVQLYYADTLFFRNVHFEDSADVGVDTAELWDTRFNNCLWDSSGSQAVGGGVTAPMLWLRNSAATSGFGYSAGTVNNVYFEGCRWEQYTTGAVRIERGLGTNVGQPYSLYWVNSKFETALVNGGDSFFCDVTARDINVMNCHAFVGGFQSGYSTAVNVFNFGPQFGSLVNILIFNSTATVCIASGVLLNSPLAKSQVVLENVRGSYTGGATPTSAHITFGTNTGGFILNNCGSDNGTVYAGNQPGVATNQIISAVAGNGLMSLTNGAAVTGNTAADLALIEFSATSQALGILVAGDTFSRFQINSAGLIKWGSGAATGDVNISRTGAGQLTIAGNAVTSGTGQTTGIHTFSAGTKTAGGANILTPTFVSGTAAQLSDITHDYMVYFTVGTAGTAMLIKIGATSTPANTIVSSSTATGGEVYSFRLPAGWFVQWSATTATLANQIAIGC